MPYYDMVTSGGACRILRSTFSAPLIESALASPSGSPTPSFQMAIGVISHGTVGNPPHFPNGWDSWYVWEGPLVGMYAVGMLSGTPGDPGYLDFANQTNGPDASGFFKGFGLSSTFSTQAYFLDGVGIAPGVPNPHGLDPTMMPVTINWSPGEDTSHTIGEPPSWHVRNVAAQWWTGFAGNLYPPYDGDYSHGGGVFAPGIWEIWITPPAGTGDHTGMPNGEPTPPGVPPGQPGGPPTRPTPPGAPPALFEPAGIGIDVSFTPNYAEPPVWTRVDDPEGI